MQFTFDRFRVFPEMLKLSTFVTTIFIILSIAAVKDQPPGTAFIWISSILAIIVDCLFILTIGLELEKSLFPHQSLLNWPLLTFCLANFVQYTLNVIYHIRNWINEQNKAMQVIDPRGIGITSYGGS